MKHYLKIPAQLYFWCSFFGAIIGPADANAVKPCHDILSSIQRLIDEADQRIASRWEQLSQQNFELNRSPLTRDEIFELIEHGEELAKNEKYTPALIKIQAALTKLERSYYGDDFHQSNDYRSNSIPKSQSRR
jgi:DNA repair ATPase RecN